MPVTIIVYTESRRKVNPRFLPPVNKPADGYQQMVNGERDPGKRRKGPLYAL
jgi:hypothetical protein